ncbi:MAG TPA: hypothetical protein VHZ76_01255 [Gammaproteobacteria bacterium]|jgi:hypothetical protein|nr:hypothetical protein [Gammaproteobacteria bacterium]
MFDRLSPKEIATKETSTVRIVNAYASDFDQTLTQRHTNRDMRERFAGLSDEERLALVNSDAMQDEIKANLRPDAGAAVRAILEADDVFAIVTFNGFPVVVKAYLRAALREAFQADLNAPNLTKEDIKKIHEKIEGMLNKIPIFDGWVDPTPTPNPIEKVRKLDQLVGYCQEKGLKVNALFYFEDDCQCIDAFKACQAGNFDGYKFLTAAEIPTMQAFAVSTFNLNDNRHFVFAKERAGLQKTLKEAQRDNNPAVIAEIEQALAKQLDQAKKGIAHKPVEVSSMEEDPFVSFNDMFAKFQASQKSTLTPVESALLKKPAQAPMSLSLASSPFSFNAAAPRPNQQTVFPLANSGLGMEQQPPQEDKNLTGFAEMWADFSKKKPLPPLPPLTPMETTPDADSSSKKQKTSASSVRQAGKK